MRLLLALCLMTLAAPGWARLVEAEGSAIIVDGAVQMARQQAIQDAMRQAALQTRAWVQSASAVSGHVLVIDSARINADGPVEGMRVLDEWREGDIYHVRIRAHTPAPGSREKPAGGDYRKRVAALQFAIENPRQVSDLAGIERAWPRALLRALAQSGHYLTVDGSDYLLHGDTLAGSDPGAVAALAERLGVQFLVAGTIRDLGFSGTWLRRRRDIETELFVFDGLSGALLARHRISERVPAAAPLPAGLTPFSLPAFQGHPVGRALLQVLERQRELVHRDLAPLPFTARVVAVEGDTVTFDAGSTAAVQPGDLLMTYRLDPQPLRGLNDRFLGYRETPVAALTVRQVQPQFALGELESPQVRLHPGDLIRFGWR